MIKKFLSGTLLAAMLLPMSAFAQNNNTTGVVESTSEFSVAECPQNCPEGRTCKFPKKGDKKGGKKVEYKGDRAKCDSVCLFGNLNLSTEQQAQLNALNEARKQSRKEFAQAAKAAKEAGDTAFFKKNNRQELQKKYLSDLQTILTPAQYVQFLENSYLQDQSKPAFGNRPQGPKSAKVKGGPKATKGDFKPGKKSDFKAGKKGDVRAAKLDASFDAKKADMKKSK